MKQLRIIKRNGRHIVQVRVRHFIFWHKWVDVEDYCKLLKSGRATRGYQPFPKSEFLTLEKAESFCENWLLNQSNKKPEQEQVVKTYNTGIR